MNFSIFLHQFLSIEKPITMSKRAQERRTGEELVVAKIEASEVDIKKFGRDSMSHVGSGHTKQPWELQIGSAF